MASIITPLVPVTYFGISSAIGLIALNASQAHRIYFAPFLLLFALQSFRHLGRIPSWLGLDSLWGLFITIYVMHITAVLYVEKWVIIPLKDNDDNDHDDYVFVAPEPNHQLFSWDLRAGYKVWSNPRWLPPTPSSDGSNTRPISSESQCRSPTADGRTTMASFVVLRSLKLLAYALTHHLINAHIFPGHFRPMTINDFSPHREHYLSRLFSPAFLAATLASGGVGAITFRETLVRAVLAVDWVVAAYLLLEGCHHISALLFVCVLRLDEPDEWPPFFGSVCHITSIQRFWGRFWHRLVVGPYGSHAKVLSRKFLGFEAGSRADKLVVTCCIFLFSGLAHSAVSWQMGQRCGVWRDTMWFVMNFGAGIVEGVVQRWCMDFAGRMGAGEEFRAFANGTGGKVVGSLWVFAFFFWSVPKWQFPKIYCATLIEIYNK